MIIILLLYSALYFLSEKFSQIIGKEHILTPFTLAAFAIITVIFAIKYNKYNLIKLNKPKKFSILIFLSIILGAVANVISYFIEKPEISFDINEYLLILVCAVCEELFFRGVFLTKLRKKFSCNISVLISSIIFALLHTVNLLTQTPNITALLLQIIFALTFGFAMSYVAIFTDSVILPIVAHLLINATSVLTSSNDRLSIVLWLTVCFIYLILARILYRKTKETSYETIH